MKNIIVENNSDLVVALIKFEHSDWGVRYKTLILIDDQWTEEELIEYANKERVNGESFEIILKIANLINNMTIDIKGIM